MAGNFPEARGANLKSRPGHYMAWSCVDHSEPIKFYCVSHALAVCLPCATKDHCQKPCKLEDIGDVIKQLEKELEKKLVEIEETKQKLKERFSEIKACDDFAKSHLESVQIVVNNACEKEIQSESEKEKKEAHMINEEADEKIRPINEEREARLRKCHESAEQRKTPVTLCQQVLLQDVKDIASKVQEMISELENRRELNAMGIQDSEDKIKKILRNHKDLVSSGRQVIAVLDEALKSNEDQDSVDKINHAVQGVRLTTAKINGEFYGRVEGYIGKWEIVDTISIPEDVGHTFIAGMVGEDDIGIAKLDVNGGFFVTHISNKHTENVIQVGSSINIDSYAGVNSDAVACGRGGFKYGNGCISLYNKDWKLIRNIRLPGNTEYYYTPVYVDVDRDGMIIAAESHQSNIYVIDSSIVNTISVKDSMVYGPIRVLSSGDIVVQTYYDSFSVISRSGAEKTSFHDDKWGNAECSVDQLTDTLYITYWDDGRGVRTVDQVSRDGVIQARGIVEYASLNRDTLTQSSYFTPSGKLVTTNGNEVFIYKKIISVKKYVETTT